MPQNWVGEGPCWCILPALDLSADYAARLEAAPLAPYGSELQEIRFETTDGRTLLRRVLPASSPELTQRFRIPAGAPQVDFHWRRLGAPSLAITVNNQLLSQLVFASRPDMQARDFLLRRDLLAEKTILGFQPNFSISPDTLEGSRETRVLSFRFFRLSLFRLP